MTKLMIAAAVLGLSAASASAECNWQHSAQAKADPMITASVANPATPISTPATVAPQDEVILPEQKK